MNKELLLAQAMIKASKKSFNLDCFSGKYDGICALIDDAIYDLTPNWADRAALYRYKDRWMRKQVKAWPEFSGNQAFPVPSPHKNWSAEDAFSNVASPPHLQKWEGEYGASRRCLFAFLLERIAAEL